MTRSPLRVVPLLLAATTTLTLAVLVPVPALRAALALPIALVLPGAAVLAAAFGPRPRVDPAPALALSVLLSAAVYPVLSLALFAAGIELSLASVVAATDLAVLAAVAVVVLRSRDGRGGEGGWLPARPDEASAGRSPWAGRSGALLFAAAVGITAITAIAAAHALPTAPPEPYVQLYLRDGWARVNRVVEVPRGRSFSVAVGIANRTARHQRYRLAPRLDGGRGWAPQDVTVAAGGRWAGSVSGALPERGCLHRLTIALEPVEGRGDDLRALTVWIRTAGAETCATP